MVLGHLLIFNHFEGLIRPRGKKSKISSGPIDDVIPIKFFSVKPNTVLNNLKTHSEVMADFFYFKTPILIILKIPFFGLSVRPLYK